MKNFYKILTLVLCLCVGTEAAMSSSLQTPGQFYIKSVSTGKYVVLQHSQLADITADAEGAEAINVGYTLQSNGEGIVTTLNSDNGDMIETLKFIRDSFEAALESENMPTDFLDEMFTLHLVLTGDEDGSVYLCVDVPEIDNFDNIRNFLMEASGYQQAIVYYLGHMVPGNRHYLAVDYDNSFGFRPSAGDDSKWLMIPVKKTAIDEISTAKKASPNVYDLLGRPVSNPSGFYIKDGMIYFSK